MVCHSLSLVTFEPDILFTVIPDNCFVECSSLTSIIIPKSVATISNNSFRDCSNLTSVTIEFGSSLSSIGVWSFKNTNLTTLIYENITYDVYDVFEAVFGAGNIGTDAFLGTPFIYY